MNPGALSLAKRCTSSRAPWTAVLVCLVGVIATCACRRSPEPTAAAEDEFVRLMNVGKNFYDRGDAQKAIEPFQKAAALNPAALEARLNLANAFLLAGQAESALAEALKAIDQDHNAAAAYYVAGCAQMRLRQFEPALKSFQTAKDIDPRVGAVTFQLARAHQELGHWEEAITLLQELLTFEPEHPVANYALSQALIRVGRTDEANAALERHRKILEKLSGTMDLTKLERCVYTEAIAPKLVEWPDPAGLRIQFADVTAKVLSNAPSFRAPIGIIDFKHDGWNSLFVGEGDGFRLLVNSNFTFQPQTPPLPGIPGSPGARCFVADLQNDRVEDVLVLGDQGTKVFKFTTNAQITDSSVFSRLSGVPGTDGALLDLDFTGKLDLLAAAPDQGLRVMRNLGGLYFKDITATSGVPASATGIVAVAVEDWNSDDLLDVVLARRDQPPLLLLKQRGGPLVAADTPPGWPPGRALAFGDYNNDLRPDLLVATADHVELVMNGLPDRPRFPVAGDSVRQLVPMDYDNDGWLDLVVAGRGLRVWRNLGHQEFRETTADLGLASAAGSTIEAVAAADLDIDGDTDLVLAAANEGLKILRNDGANANLQVKVRLLGNRSNASGIGTRVEATAGGLQTSRRVMTLPIEIGVARHQELESLDARWLNVSFPTTGIKVDPRQTLLIPELSVPEGSCPYLYAWTGKQFRFVTDLLGSAPLGLRATEEQFVEADPDELVWLGGPGELPTRNGAYEFRLTEELREVLYLDAAELVVVDHPAGTEVYTTGKMVPGPPFPPHEIVTLHRPYALRGATRSDGLDVADLLSAVDCRFVSPVQLRIPQLRGLAEPWSVTLDFGPLPVERPLVLAITAWLRFGGGMANVAASQAPALPFPFPRLEVETAPDHWQPVGLVFGVPAGKTKNFIVDLAGCLPPGSRRLRISTAYELHWDRIALMEKTGNESTRIARFAPDTADLHWRGFSPFEDLPWDRPLTPDYDRVNPSPSWRITPVGWCTRYGDVRELVERRDNALALLNGGDELTLRFTADRLPAVPPGCQRGFFLYSSGWDKDADFHCEQGWRVDPLPWHGMDSQAYGRQKRPAYQNDDWIRKYNTRWVGLWVPRRNP